MKYRRPKVGKTGIKQNKTFCIAYRVALQPVLALGTAFSNFSPRRKNQAEVNFLVSEEPRTLGYLFS